MATKPKTNEETVSITQKEAQAIARISEEYFDNVDPRDLRAAITSFAIANWSKLEPLFIAQLRYATAEDLDLGEFWGRMLDRDLEGLK